MKKFRKVFILFTLAFSLIGTSCDGNGSEPETTEETITNVNDPNFPKDEYNQPLFPEGTKIEFKKVEEEDKTTVDYTATWPNGTESIFHEVESSSENSDGKMITTVESTLETTFSETDKSGKKTEVVRITASDKDAATKGEVKVTETTTEYKDGSKSEATKTSEGKTGYAKTEVTTKDKNGNKTAYEEIEHFEIDRAENKTTAEGIPLASTETSEKTTYDAQGKEAAKIVTETTNPGANDFFNKRVQTEYTYENGVAKKTKRTEQVQYGCNEVKTYDYTTGEISVSVKDTLNGASLGTGSGKIEGDKATITITYTNGIELTTVEEGNNFTKEIYTESYYEKTVTVNEVLISKECEYFYDNNAGIVFKTVSTFSNGTETKQSGRYIKVSTLSPAKYDTKYVKIPSANGIYADTDSMEIYADGSNAGQYTKFTTKAWNGSKGNYDIIDYPYDANVNMTKLHFPPVE